MDDDSIDRMSIESHDTFKCGWSVFCIAQYWVIIPWEREKQWCHKNDGIVQQCNNDVISNLIPTA
jgi:hypothetical protein